MSQIQETRMNRNRKQKHTPWLLILILGVLVCGGGYLIYQSVFNQTTPNTNVVQNNTTTVTNVTASTTTQTSQSTTQTSQSTTQTSQSTTQTKKYELVIENGIAKVGDIIIVNKRYGLPKDYNPGENPQAKQAFLQLKTAMQEQGFTVSDQYSGFRSYAYQEQLYQQYVQQDGKENADTYSARPGHSEHQTGLAYDFIDDHGDLLGEHHEDPAANWLAEHAHEYGFIVRYQVGKEKITGYQAEAWHIRYLGDLAKDVYESGLTLEEFFGIEGGGYGE